MSGARKSASIDPSHVNSAVDDIIESKTALNPYEDLLSYDGFYHNIKMLILVPISIIRVIWILLMVFMGYTFSALATEQQLLRFFHIWPRLILVGFGFHYVPVKNLHYLIEAKRDRCIAVYNHMSLFDGFLLCGCVHPFAFVVNSDQGSLGVLKHVARKLHYVLVDYARGAGQTSKITEHAERPGSNLLAIAPEGTTSNGSALLRFRSGAFVPLRPVLPVLIRSARPSPSRGPPAGTPPAAAQTHRSGRRRRWRWRRSGGGEAVCVCRGCMWTGGSRYRFRHYNPSWTFGTSLPRLLWRAIGQVRVPALPAAAAAAAAAAAPVTMLVGGAGGPALRPVRRAGPD